MAPQITRRDIFKFCGGAAAGILFSPLPWKMVDDLAIWSQNPGRIPLLPRGENSIRFTGCAVCPAGCGVRVRCVGGHPVGLAGIPGHPAGGGALCPLGSAGHHLPYHPARLRAPVRRLLKREWPTRQVPTSPEAAIAALASAVAAAGRGSQREYVAILDPRPGRALSSLYRRFLAALPDGLYIAAPRAEEQSLDLLCRMLGVPAGSLGYDLENCRTLVSFGAPVLEGWGGPGRVLRLRFGPGAGERRPRFLQAETRPSRTALFADRWLSLQPGTEAALALGMAHVILQEGLCDVAEMRRRCPDFESGRDNDYAVRVKAFEPGSVSRMTGLDAEEIRQVAREFARETPSLAIGGTLDREAELAVAGLNFLSGSVGRKGGVLFRAPVPETVEPTLPALTLAEVPDHSLRLLILDDSPGGTAVAWEELERKLVREGALVASLSSFLVGPAARADYVVPAPPWLEGYEETTAPPGWTVRLFGISVPLIPAPPGARDRADTLHRVAALAGVSLPAGSSELLLRERARAIFEAGRGEIFRSRDGERSAVSAAGSPEGLWKILEEGGCWVGEEGVERPPVSFRMTMDRPEAPGEIALLRTDTNSPPLPGPATFPLVVIPFRASNPSDEAAVPLLASKLDRESGLNPAPGCALVHPETGRRARLRDGRAAWIETPSFRLRVVTRFDNSVKPGIVHLAVGPASSYGGDAGREVTTASLPQTDSGSEERRFRARMREA